MTGRSQRLIGMSIMVLGLSLATLSGGWLLKNLTIQSPGFLPEQHQDFSLAIGSVAIEFPVEYVAYWFVAVSLAMLVTGLVLFGRSRVTRLR